MRCAVEIHVKPEVHKMWAPHSVSGFYVGTSFEHYQCNRIWVKGTRSIRTVDTVFFNHTYLIIPMQTKADGIEDGAKDLKWAIEGGIPQSNKDRATILKLMEIFKQNTEEYKNIVTVQQRVQGQSTPEQREHTE